MSNIGFEEFLSNITENLSADEILSAKIKGEIAAAISETRQNRGMSQKEFAAFMGVSQGLVSRWETGETNFTVETLVDISQKLLIPMRCPYARKPPVRYGENNIISFHSPGCWTSGGAFSKSYRANVELEEM